MPPDSIFHTHRTRSTIVFFWHTIPKKWLAWLDIGFQQLLSHYWLYKVSSYLLSDIHCLLASLRLNSRTIESISYWIYMHLENCKWHTWNAHGHLQDRHQSCVRSSSTPISVIGTSCTPSPYNPENSLSYLTSYAWHEACIKRQGNMKPKSITQ